MAAVSCGIGPAIDPGFSAGAGYGIVFGVSIAFTLITSLLVWLERRYMKKSLEGKDEFNTAGGDIQSGLTGSVIVSQWTWAATLLQSCTVAYRYGVSGPFWYSAGGAVQIFVFGILAVELKRKAPFCRTFLEIVRARYGRVPHLIFVTFALVSNVLITGMCLLGGSAAINAITGSNKTIISFLMPLGYVLYTYMGGLKAKFIACYFNTTSIMTLLFIFSIATFSTGGSGQVYSDSPPIATSTNLGTRDYIGSPGEMYRLLQDRSVYASYQVQANPDCVNQYPFTKNAGASLVTMASGGGFTFGVINMVNQFATVFLDQSYWQSAVAARRSDTVKGFILGGLVWFCVPFTLATAMGLGAQALGGLGITIDQAESGVVLPMSALQILGSSGAFFILVMVFVAVISTGSGELMAMSSIITFDLYKAYVRPSADEKRLLFISRASIALIGLGMGLFGILIEVSGISLAFMYNGLGIVLGGSVIPIALTLMSSRINGLNAVVSSIVGGVVGLICWLATAPSTAATGGGVTIRSLGSDTAMLAGNLGALLTGGLIAGIWCMVRPANYDFSVLQEAIDSGRTARATDSRKPADREEEERKRQASLEQPLEMGDRVRIADVASPGTIVWIGEIDDDAYYGIMLDEKDGNTDGTFGGQRYFQCSKDFGYFAKRRILSPAAGTEQPVSGIDNQVKLSIKIAAGLSLFLLIIWPMPFMASSFVFSNGFFGFWVVVSLLWATISTFLIIGLPLWESRNTFFYVCGQITGNAAIANFAKFEDEDVPEPVGVNLRDANVQAVLQSPAPARQPPTPRSGEP